MPLHGKNFIGGQISARGSDTFQPLNPATGEKLEPVYFEAREDEISQAAESAALALEERHYNDLEQNAALLELIAIEIEALGDRLLERAHLETALPLARLASERQRTVNQLRLLAGVAREGSWVDARIDRAIPGRTPQPKPDLRRMLVPIGAVAVFGAGNFPLAFSVAGGDTASALAAGCPVVVKAHPSHPGTSELTARAVQKALADASMPEDWFSMVHSADPAASLFLVQLPAIRAVAFTGSQKAGKALFDAAMARAEPIPVYAEMGSVNPLFLLPGAMAERAESLAAGIHQSVTLGVGQFCTNPGLVVAIDGEPLERLLEGLRAAVRQTPPCSMLSQRISRAYAAGVERLASTDGVELLASSPVDPEPDRAEGAAMVFATDAQTFLDRKQLHEEVFGPATLVVRCQNLDEMLDVAAGLKGQLTATVHATPTELALSGELLHILQSKAGRLIANGFPTGVEVSPAMHHGGPYPATTDIRATSVGTAAILRFARPVCYQDFPEAVLPPELRDQNVRGIWRMIDGVWGKQ
ncbi:MAG: aldehyde dehydrogenase (NADP(+)) [Thermoguttaceae bacterium]|nr:aldehyde dehydrogenase (NADP(+)) [Thermoguttaceae bacterium]